MSSLDEDLTEVHEVRYVLFIEAIEEELSAKEQEEQLEVRVLEERLELLSGVLQEVESETGFFVCNKRLEVLVVEQLEKNRLAYARGQFL